MRVSLNPSRGCHVSKYQVCRYCNSEISREVFWTHPCTDTAQSSKRKRTVEYRKRAKNPVEKSAFAQRIMAACDAKLESSTNARLQAQLAQPPEGGLCDFCGDFCGSALLLEMHRAAFH